MFIRTVVSAALIAVIATSSLDAQTKRRSVSSGSEFACDDSSSEPLPPPHPCAVQPNPSLPACGDTSEWRHFDADHGRMLIWYGTDCPADERVAADLVEAVESDHIWDRVSDYIGAPMPDGDAWCRNGGGNGGGPEFDIYLEHSPFLQTNSVMWYDKDVCQGVPVYLYMNKHEPRTIAHEMMHAAQASYTWNPRGQCLKSLPGDPGAPYESILWWAEATATAGEVLIYPKQRLRDEPLWGYMNCPERPLDFKTQAYGYSVYIFPLFLEKKFGPGTVKRTWKALENAPNIATAIDTAMREQGGFKTIWPMFTRILVNQPPWDELTQWEDLPHKAKLAEDKTLRLEGRADAEVSFTPVPLHRLSARFYHLKVDPDVRSLTFVNPYRQDERVAISALVKYAGRDPVEEDWTQDETRYFCLDKKSERVEEVTLVVSNSTFEHGAAPIQEKKPIRFIGTNIGCWRWKGSSTVNGEAFAGPGSVWRIADATFTFERTKSTDTEEGRIDDYELIDSFVHWRSGARPCGDEKSGTVSLNDETAIFTIYNWRPDAKAYRQYEGGAANLVGKVKCDDVTHIMQNGIDWFSTMDWRLTNKPAPRIPPNGRVDETFELNGFHLPGSPAITQNLRRTWKLEPLREE